MRGAPVATNSERLPPRDQLLEAGVAAQRIEVGIDPEPAGREVVRDLQKRLEPIERLLRFSGENVDPHELVLQVAADHGVLRYGHDGNAALALPDRFLLPAEVR